MSSSSPSPSPSSRTRPVVLMTTGAQPRNGHPYQVMTHKYIKPLVELSGCVPLLVPTCCGNGDLEQYLALADGVYLSGAGSNIDPALYGQENLTPDKAQDRERDLFDLALIRAALERGLPLLGICRGLQEINVALGGDIHQRLYNEPGFADHRENGEDPLEIQYGERHQVTLVPGSWFAELMGATRIPVNSLHGQGIRTLAGGLAPLAHADDGLIEAIHAPAFPQFTLAVQWHPEWRANENPYSIKLFDAFGAACRQRRQQVGEFPSP